MKERRIDLKDLCRRILLNWRYLVASALAGCLLLTVWGIVGSVSGRRGTLVALGSFLGILLGIFVCSVAITAKSMFSTTLQTKDDIADMYQIPMLGSVFFKTPHNKKFSKVDRFVYRLFQTRDAVTPERDRIAMLCTDIRLSAKKAGMYDLCFTGTSDDKYTSRVRQACCEELRSSFARISVGGSVTRTPESLEKLVSSDGVVLFERVNVSSYEDIKKEIELCQRYRIPVIGCIVIES